MGWRTAHAAPDFARGPERAGASAQRSRWHWMTFACLATAACNDITTEEVPVETCVSGKRWIGGDRGSPNMYPGRDCVGCHADHDAPPLILGGTFYATREDELQGEDCFGLEGVTITIKGGDGQVFETVTNEAGNFWFAGRDVDIVMPYQVTTSLINPVTGMLESPAMTTAPLYGGCARCHTPEEDANPNFTVTPPSPDYVNGTPRIGINGTVVADFPEPVTSVPDEAVAPDP